MTAKLFRNRIGERKRNTHSSSIFLREEDRKLVNELKVTSETSLFAGNTMIKNLAIKREDRRHPRLIRRATAPKLLEYYIPHWERWRLWLLNDLGSALP
jgi:hypothetical protein